MIASLRTRLRGLIDTPVKVHALGVAVSLALIVAVVSVDKLIAVPVGPLVIDGKSVSVDQATQLLDRQTSIAASMDQQDADHTKMLARAERVKTWLYDSSELKQIETQVYELGKRCGIKPITFRENGETTGQSFTVRSLRCKARASYANVCRLLHHLAHDERPIHCERVVLKRTGLSDFADSDADTSDICEVEWDLRIPYVTSDSRLSRVLFTETSPLGLSQAALSRGALQ